MEMKLDITMKTTPPKSLAGNEPIERLLPEKEVQVIDGMSHSTRWRERRDGNYPEPVKISRGRVAYRESEIRAWVAAKIKAADKAAQNQEASDAAF